MVNKSNAGRRKFPRQTILARSMMLLPSAVPQAWVNHTGKLSGIFGAAIQWISEDLKELLHNASYVNTRETESLKVLASEGNTGGHIIFAQDAAFSLNILDEDRAALKIRSIYAESYAFMEHLLSGNISRKNHSR